MKKSNAEYKKYRLYGTIGMVALFLMGAIVGFIISGFSSFNRPMKQYVHAKVAHVEQVVLQHRTCEKIEKVLSKKLVNDDSDTNAWNHINDAQVYANLSERGCPENSEKYKALASQELEIARALTDDNIEQEPNESVEIVETYKRLQMQAEAERMIEKAKKLTNPAIDFIIQLEKIIDED